MAKKSSRSPTQSCKKSSPSNKSPCKKKGGFKKKLATAAMIGLFIRYVAIPLFIILLIVIIIIVYSILFFTGTVGAEKGQENFIKLNNDFQKEENEKYNNDLLLK
jgi:uncharacterized membrane protein YukC